MQSGFYSNTGGMVTQFNRLDVISNNLANLNTNGYKKDDVVIGDFMRLYQEKRDELPLDNNTKEGSKFRMALRPGRPTTSPKIRIRISIRARTRTRSSCSYTLRHYSGW